jgi:hypothetical protein
MKQERFTKSLTVRLDEGLHGDLIRLAKDHGETPASFARQMLLVAVDQLQDRKKADPLLTLCAITLRLYRSHLVFLSAFSNWTHYAFCLDDHMDDLIKQAREDMKRLHLQYPTPLGPSHFVVDEWGWSYV